MRRPTFLRIRAVAPAMLALAVSACGGGGGTYGTSAPPVDAPVREHYSSLEMAFASSHHAAVKMADGRVAVVGGSRGLSTLSDSVDLFDPAGRTWTHIASMVTGRSGACAIEVAPGRLFVNGGAVSLSGQVATEWIDTRARTATPGAADSPRRLAHTCTLLADGHVLVVGGRSNESFPGGASMSAEIWNPATGAWRFAAGRMQSARSAHTATLLPDGRVLLVGGFGQATIQGSFEIFDPVTEVFTQVAAPAAARSSHAAFLQGDGSVTVVGGEDDTRALASIASIDARHGTAELAGTQLAAPLSAVTGVARPDGSVLLFGGLGADFLPRAQAWLLSRGQVQARMWLPSPRAFHSATLLADGRVLILGGEGPSGALLDQALLYD
ncbi:MAG: Kelch repeat-containing protein [Ramlibacter sp.]